MSRMKNYQMQKCTLLDKLIVFIFDYPYLFFLLLFVILLTLFGNAHTVAFVPKDIKNQLQEIDDFGSAQSLKHAVKTKTGVQSPQCSGFTDTERFDCLPQGQATEDLCNERSCCWAPVNVTSNVNIGVPFCYYPSNYKTYNYVNISRTDVGGSAFLENVFNSTYPDNIQTLKIDFVYLSDNVLRIVIYDPVNHRYESPFPNLFNKRTGLVENTTYYLNIDQGKLGFNVVRKGSNSSIFNAENVGGFIYSDQFLQLSAHLPSRYLYGLGYQRNNFLLDMNWRLITLFNRDQAPVDKSNLYGTHPFYLAVDEDGLSSGVLLHNNHAMDIVLQPTPAITYRPIGGVFDFYFFLGPTPADVIRQYTELIGFTFMPPYWSLGFHLCRYGYNSLNKTIEVWNRTRAAGIPLDTQWNDIDYMDNHNDFTYDKVAYKGLPEFVDLLHKEGMHYVMILDPGISAGETPGTYPPYDEGIKEGIFVMDPVENKPIISKVWNSNSTVFPDFFHPKTPLYWQKQIKIFHDNVDFDGLWIDMNDPSTMIDGSVQGCHMNKFDNPPYLPAVAGGKLFSRTLCMSARHFGTVHYNVHNIFGSQEAVLTYLALREIRKKRPFIISRSSYPGHGHFTGIWTGDVWSTWDDMAHSVSDILSFSLFGIPMSGADICGFNGGTTAGLCERWSQIGAFYPFSRNHNADNTPEQDPVALGPKVVEAARSALLIRYSLLPYLYTLFWHAHTIGDTVARPMFVEFPSDKNTFSINRQFLWGPALLIAPLLSQEKLYVPVYLPSGRWYDFYTYQTINSKGSEYALQYEVSLLLRGGHIIPFQHPNTTTTASRKNPFGLYVSLCPMERAHGDLFWDDGDSLDTDQEGIYNYITFSATPGNLTSIVEKWKYDTTLQLSDVRVLGVNGTISKVLVNGDPANFTYSPELKVFNVTNLSVDLSQPFTLLWL